MRSEDTVNGRLYYGWYITFTLAITETISWGIIYYADTGDGRSAGHGFCETIDKVNILQYRIRAKRYIDLDESV